MELPAKTSLCSRGCLPFRRRHLVPEDFQIALHAGVPRILVQDPREPAIGCGKIAGHAMSGGVHRAQQSVGFRISLPGRGQQVLLRAIAVLRHAGAIEITLSLSGQLIPGAWRSYR